MRDFARGCIRTYIILCDEARRFHEDSEIRDALAEAKVGELAVLTRPEGGIAACCEDRTDPVGPAKPGFGLECLGQLVNKLLLGVRRRELALRPFGWRGQCRRASRPTA